MPKANIKTFVLSSIKPFLVSLKRYSEDRENNIRQLTKKQNELIYQNEQLIAELNLKILDFLEQLDECNRQLAEHATAFTMEEELKDTMSSYVLTAQSHQYAVSHLQDQILALKMKLIDTQTAIVSLNEKQATTDLTLEGFNSSETVNDKLQDATITLGQLSTQVSNILAQVLSLTSRISALEQTEIQHIALLQRQNSELATAVQALCAIIKSDHPELTLPDVSHLVQ